MGCQNCTPSKSNDGSNLVKNASIQRQSNHYNPDFLHRKSSLVAMPLSRESLDKLYKKILQPYQSKVIPFSTQENSISESSRQEPSIHSMDTSLNLQTELKLASEHLPLTLGTSIFVFPNELDSSMLKVFLAGTSYTPYAHGLFEFDVFFQDGPGVPPKIRFCTTGNNSVSFSAHLPASGIVDTSSLQSASFSSQNSTSGFNISQLIISMQCLLRSSSILGIGGENTNFSLETEEGMREYKAYCNTIKFATIKYAMLQYLECPPPGLKDFIQTYFCLKKDIIIQECNKWLAEAQIDNGFYDNIVASCNPELAFDLRNGAYFVRLNRLLQKLEKRMSGIIINEDSGTMESFRRENKALLKDGTISIITL